MADNETISKWLADGSRTAKRYGSIDFSKPVQRIGEQIRGTHPIGDPKVEIKMEHPIGDPKVKTSGQLMSDSRKAKWTAFMTDMPKGYRTKEEMAAKRKELRSKN
tara:strand:- start:250 stop:564 length:315 start_codon:yes stop_codon:yes gene_type:complete